MSVKGTRKERPSSRPEARWGTSQQTLLDWQLMVTRRLALLALSVTLLLFGCGGGEMSLPEYVMDVNAIVDRARQQYEALVATPQGAVLVAEGAQLALFTPHDLLHLMTEPSTTWDDSLYFDPPLTRCSTIAPYCTWTAR